MAPLNAAEMKTLKILSDRESADRVPRAHLEKLSRLDLVEPCPEGVCMTLRGKEILIGRK